ncbi:YdeI family protein [Paenibacillus puldeungensis]|uniref:YdeI family protein n=1 Tax=Paenibacillus puldeungensis TaxID=696536 RepID=A0ABW3RXM2_9BACL
MNADLVKKLRLPGKEGIVLVLRAPEGYFEQLGLSPEHAVVDESAAGSYDFVQMFFRSAKEVEDYASEALKAVKPNGLLWLCYPKGGAKAGTDLNRDKGWDTVKAAGYDGIALVSVDETWSAMRFRPAELVKLSSTSSRRTGAEGSSDVKPKKAAEPVIIPEDLTAALNEQPEAAAFFQALAPSHKKAYIEWITDAKRAETRQSRIAKTVEKLMQGLKRPTDK